MKGRKHFTGMNRLTQMQANPIAREAIDAMLGQLLIVLVNRAGGSIEIPIAEIDGTGRFNLSMQLNEQARSFTFVVGEKP